MSFRGVLESGLFALTAEITPPLSANPEDLIQEGRMLRGLADAVNVTDGASARVHMSSIAAACLLKQNSVEPIAQITCRDRNRIALQSDLLGAAALGVQNILVLGGDDVKAGDHPDAKPVFDLDSRELLRALNTMSESGETLSGRRLRAPPLFFLGAADAPIEPAPGWRAESLVTKADAGARFVQTQFCFDTALVRRYMARLTDLGVTERLYFLIGVGPLRSARSAKWIRDNLYGTIMPDEVIARLEAARDPRNEGVELCVELLHELEEIPGVAGAHLMAPKNLEGIVTTLKASKILESRNQPE